MLLSWQGTTTNTNWIINSERLCNYLRSHLINCYEGTSVISPIGNTLLTADTQVNRVPYYLLQFKLKHFVLAPRNMLYVN